MKLTKTFLMDFIGEKTVYIDTDLTSVNFGIIRKRRCCKSKS